MRDRRGSVLAVALMATTAFSGGAFAQQVETGGDGPDRLSLTIYNNDLVLVEDVRSLSIAAGRVKQEFPGVSASIRPETVSLSGRDLIVVEQNFDYDLLTPAKLMEGAVGQTIEIVRTNPGNGIQTREQARVLSANAGVVLQVGDKVEVLRDDRLPTRVVFDGVPSNLRPRPTLSVTLEATGAPRRDVTLNYLSRGLSWKADYVARLDEAAGLLDLTGWVTIQNSSGSTFNSATTRVVAGEVNTSVGRSNRARGTGMATDVTSGVGDAHVYLLPEQVTIAHNQTKQVGLLNVGGVAASKSYVYRSHDFGTSTEAEAAEVGIKFRTDRALPAGVFRFYLKDAEGQPRFIGENQSNHSPAGSDMIIKTGNAFDVTVQRRLVTQERVSDKRIDRTRTRYEMEYRVRNATSQPVTVEVLQQAQGRDTEIGQESLPGERVDANTVKWLVPVPANGETVLTATLTTGG